MAKFSQADVEARIAGLDEETAKNIICAMVGHSKIQDQCFGYWSCGRCGATVGDSLAGAYSSVDVVLIGHNCATCQKNFSKLGWEDKFMAPDPFPSVDSTSPSYPDILDAVASQMGAK